MNQLNFNQVGGFPMTTRILDELQKAFNIFNTLGALSGNMTIVAGCVTTGTNVSDGYVFINGEVFEFRGGSLQTKVKIVEAMETLVFEDGSAKSVIKTRYVTFGIGVDAMDWSEFIRPKNAKELSEIVAELIAELTYKANDSIVTALNSRVVLLEARPVFYDRVKNRGSFILGDIGGTLTAGTSLVFSGDCESVVIAPGVDPGNSYVDVTFSNTMPTGNYLVKFYVESMGNVSFDNDAGNPIFKILTVDKFRVGIYEASSTTQSIRIHFEVCEL